MHRSRISVSGVRAGANFKLRLGSRLTLVLAVKARRNWDFALNFLDLHLTGIVSEYGYVGHSHWLMFLFEV